MQFSGGSADMAQPCNTFKYAKRMERRQGHAGLPFSFSAYFVGNLYRLIASSATAKIQRREAKTTIQ
jgi:hypothetical protein